MRRFVAGVAVLLTLAAACDPTAAQPSPDATAAASPAAVATEALAAEVVDDQVSGGTLRWAIARPDGIVPPKATDDAGLLVVDTLFDSLTSVETNGRVAPSAASEWVHDRDGRQWTFTLRPDAQFHDGTPVRARDFAVGWARTVALGMTGPHLQDVVGYREVRDGTARRLRGVTAVDDTTLVVRLRRPLMTFDAVVGHPSLAPTPVDAQDDVAFDELPIGNGPYRMSEPWTGGQFIRVERTQAPQATAPTREGTAATPAESDVREIVFRLIAPDDAYVAFQQGRVDVSPIPAGALRQAIATYGYADERGHGVVDAPTGALYYLGFRLDRPPWDDVELRRALSQAIDRDALVASLNDLQLDPARWIVPPGLPERGAVFCGTCLHLPSLARATFERAGVTEITLATDAPGHERVAEQIAADLAAVGVVVRIDTLPFAEHVAAVEAGELDLYRFGWQATWPNAGAMLDAIVGSGAPVERGDGANYAGFADPQVDKLLRRARRAEDPAQRQQLWARVERAALRAQVIVPLFSLRQRLVVSDRVRDLGLTPWGTASPERARIVTTR